eukprot:4648760-Pyramimonas_sp.AAC.1
MSPGSAPRRHVRDPGVTLMSHAQALLAASLGVKERFKTCAVVGNSGGMLLHEYGPHIDAHDTVVRALPFGTAHTLMRTTRRCVRFPLARPTH